MMIRLPFTLIDTRCLATFRNKYPEETFRCLGIAERTSFDRVALGGLRYSVLVFFPCSVLDLSKNSSGITTHFTSGGPSASGPKYSDAILAINLAVLRSPLIELSNNC